MKVEYSSNNSGGSWWLTDDDWRKLEAAGWYVIWGGLYFCESKSSSSFRDPRDAGLPELCGPEVERGKCHGHRRAQSAAEADKVRWLGGLAREATKDFPTLVDAIREWETITSQVASDEGCNCCGPPHSFFTRGDGGQYEYASGNDVIALLEGE